MPRNLDAVVRALDLARLRDRLPSRPKVTDIQPAEYVDSLGEASWWITVVLDEATSNADRTWVRLAPIERLLRDELREAEVEEFPYIEYVKPSKRARAKAARSVPGT